MQNICAHLFLLNDDDTQWHRLYNILNSSFKSVPIFVLFYLKVQSELKYMAALNYYTSSIESKQEIKR